MNIETTKRCSKCGESFPLTTAFWYFNWRGQAHYYHRPCHRAYRLDYYARLTEAQREAHRTASREYQRRRNGTRPEAYRGVYRIDREAS